MNSEPLEVTVFVKNPDSTNWEPTTIHHMRVLPRVGEHIAMDVGNVSYVYKVVAIHHPDTHTTTACDIFIVRVGKHTDELMRLFAES